jgi:acetyltransferase-like isoleucine patch superfamily enzyme
MAIYNSDLFKLISNREDSILINFLDMSVIRFIQTVFEYILILILNLPIPVYMSLVRIIITNLPGLPNIIGCYLRGLYYKPRLKKMGKNVIIEQGAVFCHPKQVELDDFAFIDKYVTIAAKTAKVGKRVHIAPYSFITGGGDFIIEDYACIANHSSIVTSTESLKPGTRSSGPMIPKTQRDVIRGKVHIKKDAFIGTKATILTNVTIGEGSVVGAGVVMGKDTEPWKIYVMEGGKPRILKDRARLDLEDL